MSDQPDNLVLVLLRRLDGKFDKFADDMREVTQRLGLLGERAASLSRRIDGLDCAAGAASGRGVVSRRRG